MEPTMQPGVIAVVTTIVLVCFLAWLAWHRRHRTLVRPTVCANPILVLVMIAGALIGVLITHAPERNEAKRRLYIELASRFPYEDINDADVEAALDGCECYDDQEGQ
jgi:glucan phosphoethanolaminetransferase (alkaline phosphatase superfamily)